MSDNWLIKWQGLYVYHNYIPKVMKFRLLLKGNIFWWKIIKMTTYFMLPYLTYWKIQLTWKILSFIFEEKKGLVPPLMDGYCYYQCFCCNKKKCQYSLINRKKCQYPLLESMTSWKCPLSSHQKYKICWWCFVCDKTVGIKKQIRCIFTSSGFIIFIQYH